MANTNDGRSETSTGAMSTHEGVTTEAKPGTRSLGAPAESTKHPDQSPATTPAGPCRRPLQHLPRRRRMQGGNGCCWW